jgi:RHS repeat-associated protein
VIYENGVQKKLLTEEGYVDLTSGTYYYYLKDHQGNNRVVVNGSGTVTETNHYYPFGGTFASGTVQPYKYNGKELDTKAGLNWYDYGARHYDAVLGRFLTVDPLAEKYYGASPFAYCNNNPIRFIDPNGKDGWDIVVGYGIGFVTNVIPGTGFLRDTYTPTDASDYNNALRGMDNASMVVGAAMFVDGGNKTATGSGVVTTGLVVSAVSGGTATVVGGPVAAGGAIVIGAGTIEMGAGSLLMSNAETNKNAGYDRGKKSNDKEITFTQGTGEKAKKITTPIPKGFRKINEKTKNNMPIFKKGKEYISPDRDGHNGGIWKKANSINDLNSKKTRSGTYNENLNRIGD